MASESIYSWIPRPQAEVVKPPMYRSKHNPRVPPTGTTFGLQGSTRLLGSNLGGEADAARGVMHKERGRLYGTTTRKAPQDFTRRGTRSSSVGAKAAAAHEPKSKVKPAVPTRAEKPVLGVRSGKNYIEANAVEAIMSAPPRRPEPLRYTQKPDYGKVPGYLEHVRREIEEEKALIRAEVLARDEDEASGRGVQPLPESEQQALLRALKAKWEEVNRKYQLMTHTTKLDTLSKLHRKEDYERELAQLERDIELLSSGRSIVVRD